MISFTIFINYAIIWSHLKIISCNKIKINIVIIYKKLFSVVQQISILRISLRHFSLIIIANFSAN